MTTTGIYLAIVGAGITLFGLYLLYAWAAEVRWGHVAEQARCYVLGHRWPVEASDHGRYMFCARCNAYVKDPRDWRPKRKWMR